MKKPKQKKRKSRALVTGYLERIASKAFEEFPKQVTELIGKQHGIYALYKSNRLYYVGLASNIRRRIPQHLRDRHAGKWDRFSLYLVRKVDHIKELESLILRMAAPKGNATGGRLKSAENLEKTLERMMIEERQRQIRQIIGKKPKAKKRRTAKPLSTSKKRLPSLAPYVTERMKLRKEYKGKMYQARVRSDGTINYGGEIYNSPSLAGRAVTGRATDGWRFWRFRNKDGEWVKLDDLRK